MHWGWVCGGSGERPSCSSLLGSQAENHKMGTEGKWMWDGEGMRKKKMGRHKRRPEIREWEEGRKKVRRCRLGKVGLHSHYHPIGECWCDLSNTFRYFYIHSLHVYLISLLCTEMHIITEIGSHYCCWYFLKILTKRCPKSNFKNRNMLLGQSSFLLPCLLLRWTSVSFCKCQKSIFVKNSCSANGILPAL